jgi:AcrR family transcriptional regulator
VARRINPEQHAARRLHIVDAALTCFAEHGYEGATTAMICRAAAIGSGTFFHYFPTKVAVLLSILELGTEETRDWFAAQEGRSDAREVILDWVRHSAAQAADPRVPAFVRAVGAVMSEPAVASALAEDDRAQRVGLHDWVSRAQVDDLVRTDLSADSLTSWLMLILDGYIGQLASGEAFPSGVEQLTLVDLIERFLAA